MRNSQSRRVGSGRCATHLGERDAAVQLVRVVVGCEADVSGRGTERGGGGRHFDRCELRKSVGRSAREKVSRWTRSTSIGGGVVVSDEGSEVGASEIRTGQGLYALELSA